MYCCILECNMYCCAVSCYLFSISKMTQKIGRQFCGVDYFLKVEFMMCFYYISMFLLRLLLASSSTNLYFEKMVKNSYTTEVKLSS